MTVPSTAKQLTLSMPRGIALKAGLENKQKSPSVHSEQNRYFNVSVPVFLCIIIVTKPVRLEKITVIFYVTAYNINKVQCFLYTKRKKKKQEEMVS